MKDILLLHGALGASDQFSELTTQLGKDFNVHLYDFPGHGGKELPSAFSIPFFATEVSKYILEKGLEEVSIFGYSMGGYVAMYLAQHLPGVVGSVITLGTKYHWDTNVAAKECKMLLPDIIEQKVPAFAQTLKQRHSPVDWKQVVFLTSSMLQSLGRKNVLKLEEYHTIHKPILIMLGDRDKMVTLDESIAVYSKLATAQFAIIPGTPHAIEQVDSVLLAFLIRHFLKT